MNRTFAWRALAAAVMGLAPSLALALCWINEVKVVEDTVAVSFSDLDFQEIRGTAGIKGQSTASGVLFRFNVTNSKVLRDGVLSSQLLVPEGAEISMVGGPHAYCWLESTTRDGVRGVLARALDGSPRPDGTSRRVESFIPAR